MRVRQVYMAFLSTWHDFASIAVEVREEEQEEDKEA
jgi:hypothetical protein